jgi:HTH-type transcriptional regulator/antitoxin MqsA
MEKFGACPFCSAEAIRSLEEPQTLKTKFGVDTYLAVYSECQECGKTFVTPAQAEETDRRVAALRASLKASSHTQPGGNEIKELRESVGWTQKVAAEILGGGEVAFSRYEAGSVAIGKAAALVLKMAYVWPDTIARVKAVQSASMNDLRALRDEPAYTNQVEVRFDVIGHDRPGVRNAVNRATGNAAKGIRLYACSMENRSSAKAHNIAAKFDVNNAIINYGSPSIYGHPAT